jgi:hypothetical protein
VFVLASERPVGTPDHVVTDSDSARLLEKIRAANHGNDVHLVGGPRTIETYRALGALDVLELVVPFGDGVRLTESLDADAGLTFERGRALPGGSVEIVYSLSERAQGLPAREAGGRPPRNDRDLSRRAGRADSVRRRAGAANSVSLRRA